MFDRFAYARIVVPADAAMLGNAVTVRTANKAVDAFCAHYATDGWSLSGQARKTRSDGIYPGGFAIELTMSWREPYEDSAAVPLDEDDLTAAATGIMHAFDGFICARFGRRLILDYVTLTVSDIRTDEKKTA